MARDQRRQAVPESLPQNVSNAGSPDIRTVIDGDWRASNRADLLKCSSHDGRFRRPKSTILGEQFGLARHVLRAVSDRSFHLARNRKQYSDSQNSTTRFTVSQWLQPISIR